MSSRVTESGAGMSGAGHAGDEPGSRAGLRAAIGVVFFTTFALLMFQILQTVTLSLQIFHNTAFLVISLCMFGLGAGGSIAAYLRHRGWHVTPSRLWALSLAFSISLLLAGILCSRLNGIAGLIVVGLAPYLLGGLLLPLVFQTWPRDAGRIYFFDLVGSGLGAVALIVGFDLLGDAGRLVLSVAMIALLGTLGAALAHTRRAVIATVAGLVVVAVLFPLSPVLFDYQPGADKAYGRILRDADMQSKLDWSKWSYLGRLDSVIPGAGVENFGYYGDWVRSEPGSNAETRLLFASGDNWSSTIDFKGDDRYRAKFLRESVPAAPYVLLDEPDVLNIGLGGGIDVFLALSNGARSVVGVEVNPLMIEAVEQRYPRFFDDPYHDPRVTIHEIDGRTYANQTEARFDLITLTAVDTGAGLGAGAYVLSENYLYTQEAFDTYFRLLKPGGVLFVYRPQLHLKRILATATAALRARGVESPEDHLAIFGGRLWVGAVIGRDALPQDRLQELAARIDEGAYGGVRNFIAGQGFGRQKRFVQFVRAVMADREIEHLAGLRNDLSPIRDDSPFFYHLDRDFSSSAAGRTLWRILMLVSAGAAVLIFLPLVPTRRAVRPTTWAPTLGYFAAIGLGFMLVEVSLIQKLALFLGHPSYSLTVTLFSMLFFSGLGSLVVDRMADVSAERIARVVPGIALAILFYAFWMAPVLDGLRVSALLGRAAIAAGLLAPGSLLMGMLLPSMIRILGDREPALISWAWGVNALASVVASIVAVIISMTSGFTASLLCGLVCYAGAGLFALACGRAFRVTGAQG